MPSARFAVLAVSLVGSTGLVAAAQYYTSHTAPPPALNSNADAQSAQAVQWQAALAQVQASSGVSLPASPDDGTVNALLSTAKTNNLTETVGRSLLINLTAKETQGLGSDLPTQNDIVAAASAQIQKGPTPPAYTNADLTMVGNTAPLLKGYGNAVMAAMFAHPKASVNDTLVAMGYATDYQDSSKLADFSARAAEYRALAKDLAAVPVPSTIAPLHLKVINDFNAMADTYADMQVVVADPLRGLTGLQTFNSLSDEEMRLFINIAQELGKDGILFNTGEPGSGWSALLSSYQ